MLVDACESTPPVQDMWHGRGVAALFELFVVSSSRVVDSRAAGWDVAITDGATESLVCACLFSNDVKAQE